MVFVAGFAVALLILLITAPALTAWYAEFRHLSDLVRRCILAAFYVCSVPAATALYCLWQLMRNIRRNQMFERKNAKLLAVISWCCMAVAILTLASCYHYLPFGLVSVAMLFIFLIVRVVRICMVTGTLLREENSLTI